MSEQELTQDQFDRQDEVDNSIHTLIEELSSKDYESIEKVAIEWDIDIISTVREALQEVIVNRLKLMTGMEFYPYIEFESESGAAPAPQHKIFVVVNKGVVEKVYGPKGSDYVIIDEDTQDEDGEHEVAFRHEELDAAKQAGEVEEL